MSQGSKADIGGAGPRKVSDLVLLETTLVLFFSGKICLPVALVSGGMPRSHPGVYKWGGAVIGCKNQKPPTPTPIQGNTSCHSRDQLTLSWSLACFGQSCKKGLCLLCPQNPVPCPPPAPAPAPSLCSISTAGPFSSFLPGILRVFLSPSLKGLLRQSCSQQTLQGHLTFMDK